MGLSIYIYILVYIHADVYLSPDATAAVQLSKPESKRRRCRRQVPTYILLMDKYSAWPKYVYIYIA